MDNIYLKTKSLTVNYDSLSAIADIDFQVKKGDFCAITGPNGAGKTTLIRAILNLVPHSGKVYIKDGLKISYVPQHSAVDKTFPITVLEVALSGIQKKSFFKGYSNSDKNLAKKSLENAGLYGFENRTVENLSGGEFQKLLIARALCTNPDLLFLDEPTANIDIKSRADLYSLLKTLSKTTAIVMVTHDFSQLKDVVTCAVYLDRTIQDLKI